MSGLMGGELEIEHSATTPVLYSTVANNRKTSGLIGIWLQIRNLEFVEVPLDIFCRHIGILLA